MRPSLGPAQRRSRRCAVEGGTRTFSSRLHVLASSCEAPTSDPTGRLPQRQYETMKACQCINRSNRLWRLGVAAIAASLLCGYARTRSRAEGLAVTLSGGHETELRDHGRPVVLIAAALGVPPETFREAFSHVMPARAGEEPDPDQVQRNKRALLSA